MKYINGEGRNQIQLYTGTLNELIGEENPVRVIDAFVDSLNLEELEIQHANPEQTGRPAYDPHILLKLYIYGYFNRIRSSRRLMIECGRNIELFYLLGRLMPDFRTIVDFRKGNAKALKNVFKAFTRVCIELNLYGKELVRIEENVTKYLRELDAADSDDSGVSQYSAEEIHVKLEELNKRKEPYEAYLHELKETGETQKITTDPEARMIRTKDGFACCYNVQTAVDRNSHLIVEYEVTNNCNDCNCLNDVAQQAKKTLGIETIHTEADKGYDDHESRKQNMYRC